MNRLFLLSFLLIIIISGDQLFGQERSTRPDRRGQRDRLAKPRMEDTIRMNVYVDNWFMLYINGKLVAVDSIDFIPHNVISVDILPEYPMTIAVMAKDNADPATGLEYGNQIGDGGFILKFSDGTTTSAEWKAKCFFTAPLNHDVVAHETEYTPIPENWYAIDFDDSGWDQATEYTESAVGPKDPFFQHDFKGASFIWSDDLELDNTVIFRYRVELPDWKPRWNTKPDLDISKAPNK